MNVHSSFKHTNKLRICLRVKTREENVAQYGAHVCVFQCSHGTLLSLVLEGGRNGRRTKTVHSTSLASFPFVRHQDFHKLAIPIDRVKHSDNRLNRFILFSTNHSKPELLINWLWICSDPSDWMRKQMAFNSDHRWNSDKKNSAYVVLDEMFPLFHSGIFNILWK